MISKRTRRSVEPVESLKQAGIAAVKGIDETASVLDTDRVLYLKNLKIDHDGGLVLRKPIAFKTQIPTVRKGATSIQSDVLFSNYIFDGESILVIRKSTDGMQYVGVFKDSISQDIRLTGYAWDDYSEVSWNVSTGSYGTFYPTGALDFSNASIVNTSSSTIISNVMVDVTSDIFKQPDKMYDEDSVTDLCYVPLYKEKYEADGKVLVPRTLILSKSTQVSVTLDLTIVTPNVNSINFSDVLALDPNLDLDNPYSIRDAYNTSAPTVKSILPYTYVHSTPRGTFPAHPSAEEVKDTIEFNNVPNPAYAVDLRIPDIDSVQISATPKPTVHFQYDTACTHGFSDIELQTFNFVFSVVQRIGGTVYAIAQVALKDPVYASRESHKDVETGVVYDVRIETEVSMDTEEFTKRLDAPDDMLFEKLLLAAMELYASNASYAPISGYDDGLYLDRADTYVSAKLSYKHPIKSSGTYAMQEDTRELSLVEGVPD